MNDIPVAKHSVGAIFTDCVYSWMWSYGISEYINESNLYRCNFETDFPYLVVISSLDVVFSNVSTVDD